MFERIAKRASQFLLGASAIALVLMVAVLCWQILARYAFNASPPWAEQFALMLMIWMTFLGSAAGVADGFHIRISDGVDRLPARLRKQAVRVANILICLAGLLIGVFGVFLVSATWANAVPTLPLTRGMLYLVVPLSGFLIAVFAFGHLRADTAIRGMRGSA